MKLFLLYQDGSFSDAADYAENPPFQAPDVAQWIEGDPATDAQSHIQLSPLEVITAAVKTLQVEKRTNPTWGVFIAQCLLAIQHEDNEALAYLVNNFQTEDTDYQTILTQAKQLFGIEGI